MRLLDALIGRGILTAVPPKRTGKARAAISASLTPGGENILLHLSQEPASLDE